jgi:hypothetical protein
MKAATQTIKTLLDAMAFANVSNLNEFRTMLREVDRPAEPARAPNSDDALPPGSRVAVLPRIQGAL